MTGIAITMMIMFMIVIWGGLAATLVHLQRHPDEQSGHFGTHPLTTDEVLIAQEIRDNPDPAHPRRAAGPPAPAVFARHKQCPCDGPLGTVGASISDRPSRTPAMI